MRAALIGGPCTGKSILCNELAGRGYEIVPEGARQIILEQKLIEAHTPPAAKLPWTNFSAFEELVLERQLHLEDRIMTDNAFLDRGILDVIAYCKMGNVQIPAALSRLQIRNRYTHIFLLDQLPYRNDAERTETPEQAARVHHTIAGIYRDYGYNLIHVPVLSVKERADKILQHVR